MKNILFLSIATGGYKKIFESCINTHIEYCKKNGYHYTLIDQVPRKLSGAESSWIKLSLIKMALNKGYEWVAFIDADCDINVSMPLIEEYFENLDKTKSIFLAKGKSGRINAGVIFAKNTPEAYNFFENIINNADKQVPLEDRAPYENGHVIYYGKGDPNVCIIEHKLWNNNSEIDPKSYIQHYSSGVLRDWFVANRQEIAPPATKASDNLLKRGIKKIWKISGFLNAAPKISKSIKELEPYFKANYTDFR